MLSKIWGGRKTGDGAPVVVDMDEQEKKRDRQKNVKATAACLEAFAQCAKFYGVSEAALFEDLVATRHEELKKSGVKFKASKK